MQITMQQLLCKEKKTFQFCVDCLLKIRLAHRAIRFTITDL